MPPAAAPTARRPAAAAAAAAVRHGRRRSRRRSSPARHDSRRAGRRAATARPDFAATAAPRRAASRAGDRRRDRRRSPPSRRPSPPSGAAGSRSARARPSRPQAAAAPLQATPTLPVRPDHVRAMLRILEHRGQVQAQLTLHPAELGGVEVRLRQTAHGLMATVTADRADAAHVLQQAGAELRRALEAQGVQVAGLDIGMAGENQDAANARANERRAESAPRRIAPRRAAAPTATTTFPPSTPTTAPRPRRRSPSGPSSTCSRRSRPMSTVNPLSIPTTPQSTTSTTANQDAFGKDAFMKLLVEQMRHQSPTDPSDGQAWINQMTQFSMLEQMQQQSAGQVKANAAGYLGKTVSWQDAKGQSGQGLVEKVDFTGNEPTLTVAGHAGVKVGEVQDVA